MNTRDRLIELLEKSDGAIYWNGADKNFIEKIADYLLANGVTVGDANNATTTWRPASEPPKENGRYLVVQTDGKHKWQEVCKYATDLRKVDEYDFKGIKRAGWYAYDSEWGYYEVDDVTHWMPLPQPQKEIE